MTKPLNEVRDELVKKAHLKWSKRVHRFFGLSEEELSELSIVPFKAGFDECAKLLEQKEREYEEVLAVLDKAEAFGGWASACIEDKHSCAEAKEDARKYLEALGLARALEAKHRGKG